MELINLTFLQGEENLLTHCGKGTDSFTHPLECSQWPRCYQNLKEIQGQGKPQSRHHWSPNSTFLMIWGDRWILPVFLDNKH